MRRPFSLAILALMCLSQAAVRAQDAKDILAIIPNNALGFTIVNRLDQINDKAMAAAKKLHLPLPVSPLDLAKTAGIAKGVNVKGSAALILLPGEDGGPLVPILVVPVSNYADFLDQFNAKGNDIVAVNVFNQNLAAVGKGKFALLTEFEHRNKLKAILSGKNTLTAWTQPVREWLEGNDFTFLATPKGIKEGSKVMREGLAQAKDFPLPDESLNFVKGWIEGLESMFKSTESEVTHAGFGARIDDAGNLILDARALFAKGSSLAKNAASIKPMPGGPLANLPSGPFSMAFGGTIPAGVMESFGKMTVDVIKMEAKQQGVDIPADKLAKLEKAYGPLFETTSGMNYVFRTIKGREKEGLLGGMVATVATDSSANYLSAYEKSIPELNAIYKNLKLATLPIVELEKKTFGKRTIYEATSDLSGFNDDPMQKKVAEVMYGTSGKMKYSQTALNDKTVIASFTPAKELADSLQSFKKGSLKDDADVARTLGLLPKNPQWVVLINPRGVTELVSAVTDAVAPGVVPPIPQFPQTPPIGMGASLSESGVIMQIVIPVQVIDGIGRIVQGQDA